MNENKRILIAGGVAAGAGAAARSRRLDENAEIIMFEKGPDVSFSNCCLPYHISGHVAKINTLLMMDPVKFWNQYRIIAKTNHEVTKINPEEKTIVVFNSETNEEKIEHYDELILATGARAKKLEIDGLENMPSFFLKNVFDLRQIMNHINIEKPSHMTIIGGGYIGIEVAENLKEAGIEVTIVEYSNQVLAPIDFDMVQIVHKELLDQGIDLRLNSKITKIEQGKIIINGDEELETNGIIVAAGIVPNTEFAIKSGVKATDKNFIVVDEKFRTNLDHVYAVGDIIEVTDILGERKPISLAGLANKQGRFVADVIYGKEIINRKAIGSSVVKAFDVTAAATGYNEKYLMSKGIAYDKVIIMPKTAVGIMPEARSLYLKVLWDKNTHLILGAQALSKGYGAEKRIDIIGVFIKHDIPVQDLIDVEPCYAPPYATGKDAVNFAGYVARNIINRDFKQVTFDKTKELLDDGQVVIDTREPDEYEQGHVEGTVNIPMSQFRDRLSEVPKDKPVYLHCRSGQRSYNTCLYLQSLGYENVYNIAGSFALMSNYYDTLTRLYGEENILTNPIFD